MMELRVEGLCKSYDGKTVLDNVSFTAGIGVTRLFGPSGIGKTTLLRVLLGLEVPDRGRIEGTALRWAAVFQENRLLDGLDAEGNLRFALGAAYDASLARSLLCELGLGDAGKRRRATIPAACSAVWRLPARCLRRPTRLRSTNRLRGWTRKTARLRCAQSCARQRQKLCCFLRTRSCPFPVGASNCNMTKRKRRPYCLRFLFAAVQQEKNACFGLWRVSVY